MRYVIEKYAGRFAWERVEERGTLEQATQRMHAISLEIDRQCRVIEVYDKTDEAVWVTSLGRHMMPANIAAENKKRSEKLEREGWMASDTETLTQHGE